MDDAALRITVITALPAFSFTLKIAALKAMVGGIGTVVGGDEVGGTDVGGTVVGGTVGGGNVPGGRVGGTVGGGRVGGSTVGSAVAGRVGGGEAGGTGVEGGGVAPGVEPDGTEVAVGAAGVFGFTFGGAEVVGVRVGVGNRVIAVGAGVGRGLGKTTIPRPTAIGVCLASKAASSWLASVMIFSDRGANGRAGPKP